MNQVKVPNIKVPLMTNMVYSQMKPNEQRIRFQGIARVFFGF